jgi:hypothetical protein
VLYFGKLRHDGSKDLSSLVRVFVSYAEDAKETMEISRTQGTCNREKPTMCGRNREALFPTLEGQRSALPNL